MHDQLSNKSLLDMHWRMLLSRRLDERAWVLHRQGKIAFHISGIGQEAAQIGAAFALRRGQDWVVPYYRDLALMLALGLTPTDFMLSLMGKEGEPSSGGRQMPSHWSLKEAKVVSQSSPVGTQTSHAAGIGLAIKFNGDDAVVLTSIGEGSTSQGEWYEGVNWAAIHKLPVIFMVENNIYAISVHQSRQMGVESVAQKAAGLGLPGYSVNGLDPIEMYQAVLEARERARAGDGPTLIEALVHRMTPHSSDDDDRAYRSRTEVEEMKANDPLLQFQERLLDQGLLEQGTIDQLEEKARSEVDRSVQVAANAPYPPIAVGSYPVYAEEIRRG
jgi:2-oxoisovalerate dehydrogenase E1 component alpha subunit